MDFVVLLAEGEPILPAYWLGRRNAEGKYRRLASRSREDAMVACWTPCQIVIGFADGSIREFKAADFGCSDYGTVPYGEDATDPALQALCR